MFLKILVIFLFFISPSYSHELRPAIANLNVYEKDNVLNANLSIRLNLESIIAEIDFDHSNTEFSEKSNEYKKLRNMNSDELLKEHNFKIKELVNNISRDTIINFDIKNLKNEEHIFYWGENYGPIILRVNSVENEDLYSKLIESGKQSDSFSLLTKTNLKVSENIKTYIDLGFKHIIPKGLDHILFVLALFLLSSKLRPLILQVSIFTLSHTITLFLGVFNIINISPQIVEPLIALSICFVAIENLFTEKLMKLRPYIIFFFGLLHGLGFAGILNDIGVSEGAFIISLISFNLGVELGQIGVIILSYLFIALIFQKKKWYRNRVTKPLSMIIALIGFYWFIQRLI
jgi:hypothetical protein